MRHFLPHASENCLIAWEKSKFRFKSHGTHSLQRRVPHPPPPPPPHASFVCLPACLPAYLHSYPAFHSRSHSHILFSSAALELWHFLVSHISSPSPHGESVLTTCPSSSLRSCAVTFPFPSNNPLSCNNPPHPPLPSHVLVSGMSYACVLGADLADLMFPATSPFPHTTHKKRVVDQSIWVDPISKSSQVSGLSIKPSQACWWNCKSTICRLRVLYTPRSITCPR